MAKNKLVDLNNILFAQMERLSDEDITQEKLDMEVERSKALAGISKQIIENAKLANDFMKNNRATTETGEYFGTTKQLSDGK